MTMICLIVSQNTKHANAAISSNNGVALCCLAQFPQDDWHQQKQHRYGQNDN